ncbi:hypothetical protein KCU65_g303, partial [Aureobasidium melanogenum]
LAVSTNMPSIAKSRSCSLGNARLSALQGLMKTSIFLAMISTSQAPFFHAFPPAYPDGKDEFDARRPIEATSIDWLGHLLVHSGRQFARHTDWMFVAVNVLDKATSVDDAQVENLTTEADDLKGELGVERDNSAALQTELDRVASVEITVKDAENKREQAESEVVNLTSRLEKSHDVWMEALVELLASNSFCLVHSTRRCLEHRVLQFALSVDGPASRTMQHDPRANPQPSFEVALVAFRRWDHSGAGDLAISLIHLENNIREAAGHPRFASLGNTKVFPAPPCTLADIFLPLSYDSKRAVTMLELLEVAHNGSLLLSDAPHDDLGSSQAHLSAEQPTLRLPNTNESFMALCLWFLNTAPSSSLPDQASSRTVVNLSMVALPIPPRNPKTTLRVASPAPTEIISFVSTTPIFHPHRKLILYSSCLPTEQHALYNEELRRAFKSRDTLAATQKTPQGQILEQFAQSGQTILVRVESDGMAKSVTGVCWADVLGDESRPIDSTGVVDCFGLPFDKYGLLDVSRCRTSIKERHKLEPTAHILPTSSAIYSTRKVETVVLGLR